MGLREFERLLHAEERYGELEAAIRQGSNRRFTVIRTGGVLFLGAMLLVLPLDISAGVRVGLAALLWLVVAPAGLLLDRRLSKYRLDLFHTVNDTVLACFACMLAPKLWHTAMVVVTGVLVSSIPVQSRRSIAILGVGATVAMSAIGYRFNVTYWYAVVAALAAMLPGFDAYYRMSHERADATRERYDTLIDAAAVFFWEIDLTTGCFASVAGNLRSMVGYSPAEFLKMRWHDIVSAEDQVRLAELPALAEGSERALVTKVRHSDGHDIVFRHVVKRVVGRPLLRGVSSDINDLAEASETIRFQAEHDALTGLNNRSVLVAQLDKVIESLDPEQPAALLMLDLNRFKEVNDTLGHPVGDRLLQILAERFREVLADAEVVARLGGDEFAVLLTGGLTRADAVAAARNMARATENKIEIDRVKLSISPSIGVVLIPEHGSTTDEVIRHADIAMYEAKRRGESVRVFESTPNDLTLERLTLSAAISSALTGDQFELWYQPKFCLQTRAIVGAEALARWRHPERGILAPSEFLELISLAGEYHRFTDMVLEQGIATAARCIERGHQIEMAVNLSSLSFFDQQLPAKLDTQFRHYGLRPDRFTLEITEADILDEAGSHFGVFDRLQELGVGISIDDFGTGYSSLVRLRELPVTEVKLDRSFVSNLHRDAEDLIIVQTVVDLALALGHRTVAEGVELEATAEILASIGCETAQGFLFARPMPLNQFLSFVDTWAYGTMELAQVTRHSRSRGRLVEG